jgi:protein involved in polysaccharide export with SLBB domain
VESRLVGFLRIASRSLGTDSSRSQLYEGRSARYFQSLNYYKWVKSYLLLFCTLLLPAAVTIARSQTTGDTGIGAGSQIPSVDCSNPLLASTEACMAQQMQEMMAPQQTGGQLPGTSPATQIPGSSGFQLPNSLGPAIPENPLLSPQSANGNRSTETFPPDQPTEFQRFVAEITGQFLPLYGQSLFRNVPSTFAPNNLSPVPLDYVIGPDDELQVRVWGQINFAGNLRVDRSGNVFLPQVGAVPVAGLRFSALDERLRSAVAKLYRNFDLSVQVGRIRSIQVYISGQARRPGAYTISSLSSLVDALFATGGPSPQGSLRHIVLKREGTTVADFDLYALLIHGDKSGDVRLLPEDVLYIPPAGPEVAITGSVRSPGIYELRSGETVGDLIEMAGRTTTVASSTRLSLDRVVQHEVQTAAELSLDAAGLATVLTEGDILRVNPIVPAFKDTVTLRGNVANPGRFGWHAGMQLSELIPDLDSLVSRDYWWKRSHLGLPAPQFEPAVTTLGENQQPPEVSSRGLTTSVTQSTLTTALKQSAQAPEGASNHPSDDTAANPHGGNAAVAAGLSRSDSGTATEPINQNAFDAAPRNDVRLLPGQINWNYAVIERVDPKSLKPSLISFDLGKLVLDHDPSQNLALEPGDTVTIFSQSDIRVPLAQQVKYVEFEGEVVHPGYYSVQPNETLRDVLRRAGGLTPNAYLYGSEFTRESARALQQERLDDYLQSMTLDTERGAQAIALAGFGGAGSGDAAASRAMGQDTINRLSKVKATGRIVLQFRPNTTSIDDVPAISLENGDRLVVPFVPANINIVGAVYDQNSYLYEKGRTLGYYLRQAGGVNRNADWRHAFLIRADGSVISRNHMSNPGFWKTSFENLKLYPGDTIVVPDKSLRPSSLRYLVEWSQIFSQLALGAAAVNIL